MRVGSRRRRGGGVRERGVVFSRQNPRESPRAIERRIAGREADCPVESVNGRFVLAAGLEDQEARHS